MIKVIKNKIKSISLEKQIEQDKTKDSPIKYPLELSSNEREYLIDVLRGGGHYLEFGSGGSTFLALLHSRCQVLSVESDMGWIQHLRNWKVIRKAEQNERLKFLHIDIGQTGMWGVPIDEEKKSFYPNYSAQVFADFGKDFDICFIDGRFRVACLLQSVLNCPNARFLIHDFNNRAFYHQILPFVDFVDTCDTLAEFKKKQNCDESKLLALYDEMKFNYD